MFELKEGLVSLVKVSFRFDSSSDRLSLRDGAKPDTIRVGSPQEYKVSREKRIAGQGRHIDREKVEKGEPAEGIFRDSFVFYVPESHVEWAKAEAKARLKAFHEREIEKFTRALARAQEMVKLAGSDDFQIVEKDEW